MTKPKALKILIDKVFGYDPTGNSISSVLLDAAENVGEASGGDSCNEVVIVGYLDEDHYEENDGDIFVPLIITSDTTSEEINHALENNDSIILKLTNGVSDQILFSSRVLSHTYDTSFQGNSLFMCGFIENAMSRRIKDFFAIMALDSGEITGYHVTLYNSIRFMRDIYEYCAPVSWTIYRENNVIDLGCSLSTIKQYKDHHCSFYIEYIDDNGVMHYAYLYELPSLLSNDVYATFTDGRGLYVFTAVSNQDNMTGDYYPYTVDQSGHLTITEQIPGYNA